MSISNEAIVDQVKKGLTVKDGVVYGVSGKPRKLYREVRKRSGYVVYTLTVSYNGRSVSLNVARVVAYLKYGDKLFEKGIVVRHLNGDTRDFSEENIAIGTASQNQMDIPEERRRALAKNAASYLRRFSDEQEKEIIQMYLDGNGYGTVGKAFDANKSTIRSILVRHGIVK